MSLTAYRTLGRSGLRVSPLALGAMNFDDGRWGSGPETSQLILDRYPDASGNFVDTATMYNGRSEEAMIGFQQGDTTINGLDETSLSRYTELGTFDNLWTVTLTEDGRCRMFRIWNNETGPSHRTR